MAATKGNEADAAAELLAGSSRTRLSNGGLDEPLDASSRTRLGNGGVVERPRPRLANGGVDEPLGDHSPNGGVDEPLGDHSCLRFGLGLPRHFGVAAVTSL